MSFCEYALLANVGGGAILLERYWDLWFVPPGSLQLLIFWDWGIMTILLGKWNHYWKEWNLIGGLMSWGDYSIKCSVRICLSREKNFVGIGLGVDTDDLELIYKQEGIESWAEERKLHDNVWKKEGGKEWAVSPKLDKIECIIVNKRVRLLDIQEEVINGKVVRLAKRVVSVHVSVIKSKVKEVRARIGINVGLLRWVRIKISIYRGFSSIIIARSRVIYIYNNIGMNIYVIRKDSRTDLYSVAEAQKGNKSKGVGSSGEEVGGKVKGKNLQKFDEDWGYFIYGWKSKVGKELGYYLLDGLYIMCKERRRDLTLGKKCIGIQGPIAMFEVIRNRTQSEKVWQALYIYNRCRKQESIGLIKFIYISYRLGSYGKGMQTIRARRDRDKYGKCRIIVRIEKAKRAYKNKSRKYVLGVICSMYETRGIGILLGKKCSANQGTLVILVESRKMKQGVKEQYSRRQDVYFYCTNRRQEEKVGIKSIHISYRLARYRKRIETDIVGNNGYNKDVGMQCLGINEIRVRLSKIKYKYLVGKKISIKHQIIEVYIRIGMLYGRNSTERRRNSRYVNDYGKVKSLHYIKLLWVLISQKPCLAWKVEHWIRENISNKRSRIRKFLYLVIQKNHKETNKNWGWKDGIISKNVLKRKVGKGPKNFIRKVNGKYDRTNWILILMEGFEYDEDKSGIDMIIMYKYAVSQGRICKGYGITEVEKGSDIEIKRQSKESSKARDWKFWLTRIRGIGKWSMFTLRNTFWNKCSSSRRLIKQAWRRYGIDIEHLSSCRYLMILTKENNILIKGRSLIYRSFVKDPIHSGKNKERNLGCNGCRYKYSGVEYGKGRKNVIKAISIKGESCRESTSNRILCCGRIVDTIRHRFRKESNVWIWHHVEEVIGDIIEINVAPDRYNMGIDMTTLQMLRWNKYWKSFEIWTKECIFIMTGYAVFYERKCGIKSMRIERREGRIIVEEGLNCCLSYCDWKIIAFRMSEPYRKNRGIMGSILNDLKKRMTFEKNHLRQNIKADQELIQKEVKVDGIRNKEIWVYNVRNEIISRFRKHDGYRLRAYSLDKKYNINLGVRGVCRGHISPPIKNRDIRARNLYKWEGINTLGSNNDKIGNG